MSDIMAINMIEESTKQEFMEEFSDVCQNLPGIHNIEFYGSFMTNKWRHGDSDIDIAIHGENIPGAVKLQVSQLVRALNDKYDLRLGQVRCAHPTPFFIDSPVRKKIFEDAMKGHSHAIETGRAFMKKNAPTYEEVWAMGDSWRGIEEKFPVKISEVFDKFRWCQLRFLP